MLFDIDWIRHNLGKIIKISDHIYRQQQDKYTLKKLLKRIWDHCHETGNTLNRNVTLALKCIAN